MHAQRLIDWFPARAATKHGSAVHARVCVRVCVCGGRAERASGARIVSRSIKYLGNTLRA